MSLFKLKKGSRLEKKFLSQHNMSSPHVSLDTLRTFLERKISTQRLFDKRNPDIIIADEELKELFQTKAFIRQILSRKILQQADLESATNNQSEAFLAEFNRTEVSAPANHFDEDTLKEQDFICSDKLEKFLRANCTCTEWIINPITGTPLHPLGNCAYCSMKEQQTNLTSSTETLKKEKRPFGAILEVIENHLTRSTHFFEGADQGIAIIKGHLLEAILDVEALHLSQLSRLLQRQVIPFVPRVNCEMCGMQKAHIEVSHSKAEKYLTW